MELNRKTVFYSATRYIRCSKEQALAFFSRMTAINLGRFGAGKCQHVVEYCFNESEGLLIAGTDYDADCPPDDICAAIAELIAATENDYLDVKFCVCSPIFSTSSHHGGDLRIFRNGSRLLGSPNFDRIVSRVCIPGR